MGLVTNARVLRRATRDVVTLPNGSLPSHQQPVRISGAVATF